MAGATGGDEQAQMSDGAAPAGIDADWRRLLASAHAEVWDRPGLSRRTRSLVTCAALVALHQPAELSAEAGVALGHGLSRRELCEVTLHAAGYAGFPRGVEAMRVLRAVFAARPEPDTPDSAPEMAAPDTAAVLFERGTAFRREVFGQTGDPGDIAPPEIVNDWWRFLTGTAFGAIWPRPGLSLHDHSRVTLAVLQVTHMPVEFRLHTGRALDMGIPRAELGEQIMHLAIYGGFPCAVEAMRIAREEMDARDAHRP